MIEIKLKGKEETAILCARQKIKLSKGSVFAYSASAGGKEQGVCVFGADGAESEILLLQADRDDLSLMDALLRSALYYLLKHGASSAVFSARNDESISAGLQAILKNLGFKKNGGVLQTEITPEMFSHCG